MERGVLVQRSMGPRLIIVGSIGADDPAHALAAPVPPYLAALVKELEAQ
jgi:hypothetical protein